MKVLFTFFAPFVFWTNVAWGEEAVLVEAESFENTGGWVVDQQFMDQMGSPYLLAHGMGTPVADAVTTVHFPAPGTYYVFVRTKDWVAHWKAPGSPGRFQVSIDDKPLSPIFGTEGVQWHWQRGGAVPIGHAAIRLVLHDLTGFEGRCDAIVFCREDKAPPDEGEALNSFRRKALGLPDTPPDAGQYDFVVVGGGIAGVCAAVSAARLGLKVALVQDRPILGGNASSDVRVGAWGETCLPPYPAIGRVVREAGMRFAPYPIPLERFGANDPFLRIVTNEPNIDLHLNTHAVAVQTNGIRILSVVGRNIRTGQELRFPAPLFADCTGDACIGFLANADFRMGRESRAEGGESLAPTAADRLMMGPSLYWEAAETKAPSAFPSCPWAIPNRQGNATHGGWDWEVGFGQDLVAEAEIVRDYAFRGIYGHWASMKKDPVYANWKLSWLGFVAGKRESRRLLGDVILGENDIRNQTPYPDACVTATWGIDVHEPANAKEFPEGAFRSRKISPAYKYSAIYPIPYRCLYSRNIGNLFMAGRDISVTHIALGAVRVQETTGMMGEVVGLAASFCRKHTCQPGDVYADRLKEFIEVLRQGVPQRPTASDKKNTGTASGGNSP